MTDRSYNWTTNVLIMITLGAALVHDRVSSYAWLSLAIAALGGVGTTAVYFYDRWSRHRSEYGTGRNRDSLMSDVDRPV